jgi:hypothetical protein
LGLLFGEALKYIIRHSRLRACAAARDQLILILTSTCFSGEDTIGLNDIKKEGINIWYDGTVAKRNLSLAIVGFYHIRMIAQGVRV